MLPTPRTARRRGLTCSGWQISTTSTIPFCIKLCSPICRLRLFCQSAIRTMACLRITPTYRRQCLNGTTRGLEESIILPMWRLVTNRASTQQYRRHQKFRVGSLPGRRSQICRLWNQTPPYCLTKLTTRCSPFLKFPTSPGRVPRLLVPAMAALTLKMLSTALSLNLKYLALVVRALRVSSLVVTDCVASRTILLLIWAAKPSRIISKVLKAVWMIPVMSRRVSAKWRIIWLVSLWRTLTHPRRRVACRGALAMFILLPRNRNTVSCNVDTKPYNT